MRGTRSGTVIAAVAVVFLLDWGAAFFIPLCIALLISYALSPLVDVLTRVLRLRVLASALVVTALVALLGAAAWIWAPQAGELWQKVPQATRTISRSLQHMARKPSGPINEVKKAAADLESVANTGKPAPAHPPAAAPAPTINVWQVLWTGWKGVSEAVIQLVVVLFLVFFMLASGHLFRKKIVLLSGERLAQRKFTVQVIDEIDRQVRHYLGVMVIANTLVGIGTWIVFRLAGVEYAGLWGIVAAVLHTIPYFGPALIAIASLLVAFLQFQDWPHAFLVAGYSLAVATVVGMLFATWLASRRARMNATACFVGLLFFGWIWGLWGVLLGIPILAIVKTICDHNEDWKPVGELLGQ